MASAILTTQANLRQLLRYESATGKLYWLPRGPEWFDGAKYDQTRIAKWWNSRFAGQEAFCTVDKKGYLYGFISDRRVAKHRIVWLFHFGAINGEIDHVDGDPSNNRVENLRDVTRQSNMQNKRTYDRNTSGFRGVYWAKRMQKWRVAISVGGKETHLGFFADFDDAVAARKAAERAHGYHENHGRGG